MKIEEMFKEHTKLDKIYNYLIKNKTYKDRDKMIDYIKRNKSISIYDEDILVDILTVIIENDYSFNEAITSSMEIYNIVVYDKNNIEQKSLFLKIFTQYLQNSHIFYNLEYFKYIYPVFENKEFILGILSALHNQELFTLTNNGVLSFKEGLFQKIYDYILEARKFYVDENAFYTQVISIIIKIKNVSHNINEVDKIISNSISMDKKIAGIYDIDEEKIDGIASKTSTMENKQNNLEEQLNYSIDHYNRSFTNIGEKIDRYEVLSQSIIDELKKYKDELLSTVNSSCLNNPNSMKNDVEYESKTDSLDYIEQRKIDLFINNFLTNMKVYINKEITKLLNDTLVIDEKFKEEIRKYIIIEKGDLTISEINQKYLYKYYYALYNDSLNIYEEILNSVGIEYIKYYYFNRSIIDKFYGFKEQYMYLIRNRRYFIDAFHRYSNGIDLLISLIEENTDFIKMEIDFDDIEVKKIEEAVNIFGIHKIAYMDQDENFMNSLKLVENENLPILKEIYDINPNFTTYYELLVSKNEVLEPKDIAFLNQQHQQRLLNLSDYDNHSKLVYGYTKDKIRYKHIFIDKESVKKIIYAVDSEAILECDLQNLLEEGFISIDDYLRLTKEESIQLLDEYYRYSKNGGNSIYNLGHRKRMKKLCLEYGKNIRSRSIEVSGELLK